jgi:hypothetical protein
MIINFKTLELNSSKSTYKKNNILKNIIIIEPVVVHWTTVLPIVLLFGNKGWKVTVFAPKELNEIIINNTFIKKNKFLLSFIDSSLKNLLYISLTLKYDVIIVANRFFYFKVKKFTIFSFLKIILTQLLSFFFIYQHAKKSFFIITSHFVDALNLPLIKKGGGGGVEWSLNRYLASKIWSFASQKIKAINVYTSLVKIETKKITSQSTPILLAPAAIYLERGLNIQLLTNNLLKIVIPGRIDTRRRYYSWIEKIPSCLKKRIQIVLLGRVMDERGSKIIQKFEELGFPQPIARSGEFIKNKVFKKEIETANFLFAPFIHPVTIDRNSSSGSLFDSISYGKPLILPSHQPIPPEIKDNIITYKNDDDLVDILKLYVNDPKKVFHDTEKAVNNSKKFSIDQLTYFNEVLALISKKESERIS